MSNIQPHRHCIVCGNAVDGADAFCDELCESKYKSAQKRQKVLFIIFIAIFIAILILPGLMNMKG